MISIIIPCKNEPDIVDMMVETEKEFPDAQIIVSSDRYGNGKGWAIRQGIKIAKGDIICFIDGDLDIHPRELKSLLTALDKGASIVVGKKYLSGGPLRRLITKTSRLFIKALFGLGETQTGIKAYKAYAIPEFTEDGFTFDLEMLYKARKQGFRIQEVPVAVNIRKSMPVKSIINFIISAIKIRIRLCK